MNKKILITIGVFLIAMLAIFFCGPKKSVTQKPKAEKEVKGSEVVLAEKRNLDPKKYQPQKSSKTYSNGLDVSAISAIVVDENSNEIIYQKNIHEKRAPASITKICTISIALENLKKDQLITISQKAADAEPNKIVMKAGEKLKLGDLLYGLMMISANDAAFAIAESVQGGYNGFIKLMNNRVAELGLKDTQFKNPSGLDAEGHYSSAFDIATLTRYALLEHPEVITYAGEKDDHSVFATDHNESHWWSHISHMLYAYPGMIAAKTGFTDTAKSTYIGIAEKNGRRMTVVIMGATDANGDVKKLLDYGFSH